MMTVYAICAVVGGVIFVLQFVMGLIGFDGGTDGDLPDNSSHADHHVDASWLFGILTFKALVAATAFFGVAGLAASSAGIAEPLAASIAVGAGVAAMFIVVLLMRALHSLHAEGTERIDQAVGQRGTVYLTVPGQKAGLGKVTVTLQSRTAEFQAVTFADALPTGSKILVVDVVGPDTLEVIAAPETRPETRRVTHA